MSLKNLFKRNSHNLLFKGLSGFGRSMHRIYENRNHNPHSNGEKTIIKKISTTDPKVIIDGGANTGTYSKLLNSFNPECLIYSFEPVDTTYEKLKANTNDLVNVYPIKKGLFHKKTNKKINIYESSTHASIFDIRGNNLQQQKTENIKLVKGDHFLDRHRIDTLDFLKLDIEGADFDAVKGFEKSISDQKIRIIQFEYGYINITTKNLLIDFYSFFNKHGYVVGKIFPRKVKFRPYKYKYEDFIGPNFLAVHESDREMINLLGSRNP